MCTLLCKLQGLHEILFSIRLQTLGVQIDKERHASVSVRKDRCHSNGHTCQPHRRSGYTPNAPLATGNLFAKNEVPRTTPSDLVRSAQFPVCSYIALVSGSHLFLDRERFRDALKSQPFNYFSQQLPSDLKISHGCSRTALQTLSQRHPLRLVQNRYHNCPLASYSILVRKREPLVAVVMCCAYSRRESSSPRCHRSFAPEILSHP